MTTPIQPEWLFYFLTIVWSLGIMSALSRTLYPFWKTKEYISGKSKMNETRERFFGMIGLLTCSFLLVWALGYLKF